MSATNCLSHQLVTKQVWGNPTGDKPLPERTACRGPAPRACSVSPTPRSAASLGRVESRRSMSRTLRLEGAVPELSFAPFLPCRSQQRGSQNHTEQWYPHPSSTSPGTDRAPLPPAPQPGRGRRLTVLCQACGSWGRGGPLPSPLLLPVKQNQSQFYCLIFVTRLLGRQG